MNEETTVEFAELGKFTATAAPLQLSPIVFKPTYNIAFHNAAGVVGTLDFNGPAMVFTGNAEESAKIFFGWIAKSFAGRLQEERDRAKEAS